MYTSSHTDPPATVMSVMLTDERSVMSTSGMLMVAVHVYWSASEVLTGSKVRVRLRPDPILVSAVCPEESVHWMVGGEARSETTPTEQVRVSESPAWTVGGALMMVTVGGGRAGGGGRGL